ncbi:MAG: LytR/AlgR family response regulator transcription factor, partial [Pseudomonas sp.]
HEITRHQPDLVLLDIEMPRIDGFGVLRALDSAQLPYVIFVTAYNSYAMEAFNVHAIDYLLKPVRKSRLQQSLTRLRDRMQDRDLKENSLRLGQLLEQVNRLSDGLMTADPGNDGRIVVKSHGHVYFLQAREVLWVEASGDYVTIHTPKKSHLLRETMHGMEKRLAHHGFQRIHRSAIINLACISELTSNRNNEYNVVLNDGTVLSLGRSYKDSLYASLGGVDPD